MDNMREKCRASGEGRGGACPTPVYRLGGGGGGGSHLVSGGGESDAIMDISLGAPGKAPTMAEVCCRLEKEGWVNPSRAEMVRRGSFSVHHWVHTWLDGPDARWGFCFRATTTTTGIKNK